MVKDSIIVVDKLTKSYGSRDYGEIQTEFNMSLVIDGSKDSMQIEVFNFDKEPLEPNSLVYHRATQTWWCSKSDKVKRYMNDSGFFYTHTISLNGAIELLNSRDLTNCGFYQKRYTINSFLERLFELSNFEYPITFNYGDNLDSTRVVDYIKSYENYTLLSALRDFLGGYNCDCKLSFTRNIITHKITGATLTIIPKTGNLDLGILEEEEFDDVRENRSIAKDSFGTTVISNANNVVSTEAKVYPSVGSAKLSAEDSYTIDPSNAILRLPSPIFKINWIKVVSPLTITIKVTHYDIPADVTTTETFKIPNIYGNLVGMSSTYDNRVNEIENFLDTEIGLDWVTNNIVNYVNSQKEKSIDIVSKASTQTVYAGWKINAINQHIVPPEDNPDFYFPRITKKKLVGSTPNEIPNGSLLIGSKDDHASVSYPDRCMYYTRGESVIHNFRYLMSADEVYTKPSSISSYITTYANTDLRTNDYDDGKISDYVYNYDPRKRVEVSIYFEPASEYVDNILRYPRLLTPWRTRFVVNYIPMADLKIKENNRNYGNDTHIYNQNGKLNDSVALGKLINSYASEIKNEEITRYMHYTNFFDAPQVGQRVLFDDELYVINNASYDFLPNESVNENIEVGYFIDCEFTMSKSISTKSIMTSPNSNIRDYGVPQEYNIKRRQVYRDYYQLSNTPSNNNTPYTSLDDYIYGNFENIDTKKQDHTAFIKVDYRNTVDGSGSWYYQLYSTVYIVKKTIYEVVDFNDNNIIGYDMQNSTSGFVLNRLWNSQYRMINVPISYVDSIGEARGFTLAMLNKEQVGNLYNDIESATGVNNLLSGHVFIGENVYNGFYETSKINSVAPKEVSGTSESSSNYDHTHIEIDIPISSIIPPVYIDDYMPNSISIVENLIIFDPNDLNSDTTTITYYQVGNNLHLIVDDTGTQHYSQSYDITINNRSFLIKTNEIYQGAIDRADYVLEELNYNKDAIEVPVFEHSLQLNDTKEVLVGDNIFVNTNGMIICYGCHLNTYSYTTPLNATQYFVSPHLAHHTGSSTYYIDITTEETMSLSFETYNGHDAIRIKVYNGCSVDYQQNDNKLLTKSGDIAYSSQITKQTLLNKDLVIWKSVYDKLYYDDNESTIVSSVSNELMFIVHIDENTTFDGNDIILYINYKKLN